MKKLLLGVLLTFVPCPFLLADQAIDEALERLKTMQTGDAEMESAVNSAKKVQADAPQDFLRTLQSMKGATAIGRNWLASVANSQFYKAVSQLDRKKLEPPLQDFLQDQDNDAEARTLVFHWLSELQPEKMAAELKSMTNDASPELRFAAIESVMQDIPEDKPDIAKLEQLLESARHADQVRAIIKLLNENGKSIDQAKHFGFLCKWNLIGPFDNRDQKHFDTVYDVEKELLDNKFDVNATYKGKGESTVKWQSHETDEKEGMVNLANLYNREKGAVVYGYTTFGVAQAQDAQVRLTSINANKVWLNGELVLANEVYHAGTRLDQYITDVKLKQGKNVIVLKILQNEQTEQWAQDYQFHCRITDPTGKAIPVTDAE